MILTRTMDGLTSHARTLTRGTLAVLAGAVLLTAMYLPQVYYQFGQNFDVALRLTGGRFLTWVLLCPLIVWCSIRLRARSMNIVGFLIAHLVLALVFSTVQITVHFWIESFFVAPGDPLYFPLSRLYRGFTATNMVIYFMIMLAFQVWMGVKDARNQERLIARARVDAIRAQLQPHFFFNTLNFIAELTRTDPEQAERSIVRLASLLRQSLKQETDQECALSDELRFLQEYLMLQKSMYGERLDFEVRADEAAAGLAVPVLLIQPLVENAIRHGLAKRVGGGRIAVDCKHIHGNLRIEVADDGAGLQADWVEGVGLGHNRQRLELMYGKSASLQVSPSDDGCKVTVLLPAKAYGATQSATEAKVLADRGSESVSLPAIP